MWPAHDLIPDYTSYQERNNRMSDNETCESSCSFPYKYGKVMKFGLEGVMESMTQKENQWFAPHIFYRIIAIKVKYQIILVERIVRNIAVRLNKT